MIRYNLLYIRFRVINTVPKGKTQKTEGKNMTNAYAMRNLMELGNYNTSITREAFEAHFFKTRESIRFTFNGWDGKSYDGESRNAKVIRTNLPGYEEVRLIKVGKGLHYIDEDRMVIEKATGESHPEASWLVDVKRA